MKHVSLLLIAFYQIVLSPLLRQVFGVSSFCRFPLSCSSYAKEAIKRFGVFRGSYLVFMRLLKCQPFKRGGVSAYV